MAKEKPEPGPARHAPGPGRSTADGAFNELRKEIARVNERAQQAARKIRTAREREHALRRRGEDD